MKICHVTSVHPRHDIRICEKECVSLVNAGYDVYLVVNDAEDDELYKGIHIVSTKTIDGGRIGRIINAPKRVLKKALEVNAEIYHLHDPELLTISDKLIKKGKKVIFDAHEDTEKQIETKYWIPICFRNIVSKCFGLYSHKRFRRMTGIISVTPSIVEKYRKYNNCISLITNYPIISANRNIIDYSKNVDDNMPEKYVFFAGGIMKQWSHEIIIEAIKSIGGVKYLFAGKGSSEYLNYIERRGISKYMGLLSHDDVKKYYQNAIAGMALLKSNSQVGKEGTLGNTKLFEIMEAGRPVICSDLTLWKEIVEKYNCGICVDCEDASSIADAIRYLLENPIHGDEMGYNGRKAVEKEYNWATQERILYDLYDKIINLS